MRAIYSSTGMMKSTMPQTMDMSNEPTAFPAAHDLIVHTNTLIIMYTAKEYVHTWRCQHAVIM